MDDEAVGLIAWIIISVGGLVVALGAIGGIMYASDVEVGATVVETQCAGGGGNGGIFAMAANSAVTVETKFPVPGIRHTLTDFDDQQCRVLVEGRSFATYAIRSGHTVLYESEGGRCVYDSEKGLGC